MSVIIQIKIGECIPGDVCYFETIFLQFMPFSHLQSALDSNLLSYSILKLVICYLDCAIS